MYRYMETTRSTSRKIELDSYCQAGDEKEVQDIADAKVAKNQKQSQRNGSDKSPSFVAKNERENKKESKKDKDKEKGNGAKALRLNKIDNSAD